MLSNILNTRNVYLKFFQRLGNIFIFLIHFHIKSEEAAENINAISIHIRLTDYEKHLKHYYNMTTISKEYLVTAMTYMDKKYKVCLLFLADSKLIVYIDSTSQSE